MANALFQYSALVVRALLDSFGAEDDDVRATRQLSNGHFFLGFFRESVLTDFWVRV